MNSIWVALKNVLRNRRRSVTTILVVAIGCAALLIAGGFTLYTYAMLEDNAAREAGHITIADKRFFEEEEEAPMQFGIHAQNVVSNLSEISKIEFVLPRLYFSGLISNDDKSVIFTGIGVLLNTELEVRGDFLKVVEGLGISGNSVSGAGVLIGIDLARSLKARVGSSLTLMATTTSGSMNAIDVVVTGVVTTGWKDADKRLVLVDIADAQHLLMTDKVSSLSLYLSDKNSIEEVREGLIIDNNLITKPWSEQAFYYTSVKALYNRIFGLLGIIIALLVLFSVANTMSSAVSERTREIGTLRALGSYPREVIAQFVYEGMVIGVIGILIGDLLALIVTYLLPYAGFEMPPPPGRSIGYPLLVSASITLYGVIDMLMVLLCCIAALFSSRKAARMQIMEALRHV
ncbi:MAG: FtsX-like permease family protein [Azoarcus sp.]|jgi:putative ABC transport system permease protein|nr:FtsX-like permease family protein [Azoarcus sp.]